MKLKGETDQTDWHPLTLLAMIVDFETWNFDFHWNEWTMKAFYKWWGGPIFVLRIGPLMVTLA